MKEAILITGATGFLGCHIATLLCEKNYQVIATRRTNSGLKNCIEFQQQIDWVNTDDQNWKEIIIGLKPTIIIHAAWMGVMASERDDWELQAKNLILLQDLLYVAKQSNTQKIIGLGSQAEYGFIDSVVEETHPLKPSTAYGAVKILSAQLLKHFALQNNIQWHWLRVFSVFGEKEGEQWLMPTVIKTIAQGQLKKMAFSAGNQKYAYLYIKDFANAVYKILTNQNNVSGIYNISAGNPLPLKKVITLIRDILNPAFELGFGELYTRPNQSMLIAGDMSKFNRTFGILETTNFEESIHNTINFYNKN